MFKQNNVRGDSSPLSNNVCPLELPYQEPLIHDVQSHFLKDKKISYFQALQHSRMSPQLENLGNPSSLINVIDAQPQRQHCEKSKFFKKPQLNHNNEERAHEFDDDEEEKEDGQNGGGPHVNREDKKVKDSISNHSENDVDCHEIPIINKAFKKARQFDNNSFNISSTDADEDITFDGFN